VRERERVRESERVCDRERERENVCERERKRERGTKKSVRYPFVSDWISKCEKKKFQLFRGMK
jgi:hypothetical protein